MSGGQRQRLERLCDRVRATRARAIVVYHLPPNVLPPNVPQSFRVVGDRILRIMGVHASPTRIVRYRNGRDTDAGGYPTVDR